MYTMSGKCLSACAEGHCCYCVISVVRFCKYDIGIGKGMGSQVKKQFLEIGKIVATHGIHGEVRCQAWCDDAEMLADADILYYDSKGKSPLTVLDGRVHKNVVILQIDGVTTVEAAQQLRNKILFINRNDLELGEHDYFIQDLIGLTVMNADCPEKIYGKLTDVMQTGANDVYEITGADGTKRLIPAISEVILQTDVDNETMLIRPLKGLFDDED